MSADARARLVGRAKGLPEERDGSGALRVIYGGKHLTAQQVRGQVFGGQMAPTAAP